MHRCFRIARHDKTPLAGFDQNDYIEPSQGHFKSLDLLIEEYIAARSSSVVLLKSLKEIDLKCIGNANGSPMSARACAFAVIGHEIHHVEILKECYL